MFGPVYSELSKINSNKIKEEFNNKVNEIDKLYIKTNIPVPIKVQLKNTKEVVESFSRSGKKLPDVAARKMKFLKKIEFFKSVSVLLFFTFLISLLFKLDEKYPLIYLFVFTLLSIFTIIPIITSISRYIELRFDNRVKSELEIITK